MSRIERVQDGVHGLMEFVGMKTSVVEVLRTPEIQRLRRIRQLGLAHLVFPGAEHSRLVHSVGAAHLAVRFVERLGESARDFLAEGLSPTESAVRDVALAALCHDVGHGPLSHVWEREVIGEEFDRGAWCKALGLEYEPSFESLPWHELIGQGLLNWKGGQLHQLLEEQEEGTSLRVRRMLLGDYYLPYLPMILSNDVDVDRSDYIFRDAHETGVQYGRYDLNWLISTMAIGRTDAGKLVVGFDRRKAPRVVEQFLVARRALYDTVYYHKTVQSAEAMVGLLLRRLKHVARESGFPDFLQSSLFFGYHKVVVGEAIGPADILRLDDYGLWVLIRELADKSNDATLADLARRLVERDLFKMVACKSAAIDAFFRRASGEQNIKSTIAEFCPGEPEYYFYHNQTKVRMLNEHHTKRTYFIDVESKSRLATPVNEHHDMAMHWREPEAVQRLFVPREAVAAVTALVNAH